MLGEKERDFKTHYAVSLDELVPVDNFYRKVEAKLDLSFVRDLVRECYADGVGRPSVDPVVFFKLQLILFFEGFRSERQLMEQVHLNLAMRWYLGYDLDEEVPNHSTLSKIRERLGLSVFQRFFETIVEMCIDAGLVWGQELYFDGTKVQANAALQSLVPRWYWQAKEHLNGLFNVTAEDPQPGDGDRHFVKKYAGTRIPGRRKSSYRRTSDDQVSATDPDASPMRRFKGDAAKLGYHTHYVVDGGQARIILAALVTPASIMDNTPMLDLARWVRFRWQLQPKIAVGDTKYGTAMNIAGLEQDGLRAYTPITDMSQRSPFYAVDAFRFDAERNIYICPQGKLLRLKVKRKSDLAFLYRADAQDCNVCPAKAHCTAGTTGRALSRPFAQAYLDRVRAYHDTEAYQKAMRKRKVWVEPRFGDLKQWHQGRRFRLRRIHKVNIEGLLKAAGQNIMALLKVWHWSNWPDPAHALALRGQSVLALYSQSPSHNLVFC